MYLKLVENRKNNSAQDKARVKEVKAALSKLKALPPNTAMTPIVLSFEPSSTLSQLMSGQSAKFDLDGTGRSQTWSWVKPETGILCWDPDRAGKITSGRDLFGSVSWWIFFDTGYAAMDALDDNRDGCLAGDELKGLAVWFDRNSDGISDAGEVLSVESLGIASLSCRATADSEGCPSNPQGMTLADGRVLPTYDWIAKSVAEPAESPSQGLAWFTATAVLPIVLVARRRRRPASL